MHIDYYLILTVKDMKTEQNVKLRMNAIYHTCMSSCFFKLEDANNCEDKNEEIALRREARAFEQAAGLIYQAINDYPIIKALEKNE